MRAILFLLLALALTTVAAPARAGEHIVRAGQEEKVKELFGDAWSGPIGPFRVSRGRVYRTSVVVSLLASARRASIRIEHVDTPPSVEEGDLFTVQLAKKGIRITVSCLPSCSAADTAALHTVAERIASRYNEGDLFTEAPDAPLLPEPAKGGPGAAEQAHTVARGGGAHAGGDVGGLDVWRASLAAMAVWPVLAALALVLGLRKRTPETRRLAVDMALVFAGTIVAARVLAEPGMSNWYLDFLPAAGRPPPLGERLGAGAHVFEVPFRALLPWTDRTLYGLTLAVGAAGAAFFYAAVRAIAIPRATALAAAALFAVSPLGARSLASGSPHVLAFALSLLLLWSWIRAQAPGGWAALALSIALLPAIGLVRGDALAAAAMPLLLGAFAPRVSTRRSLAFAGLYVVALAASAWLVWQLVVLRSGAPLPGAADRLGTVRYLFAKLGLFRQLFRPAAGPAWIPPPLALLALLGAAVLAARRPALCVAILASLAIPQIVLVRLLGDEGLVGARYFLPALPLVALLAALPVGPVAWPTRLASPRAAALAAAAAVLATIVPGRRLYRDRYTFQEEYRFLREALADAPRPSRVYHVAVHDDPLFRRDPDCCLSPGRSPLALALPGVDFEPIDADPAEGKLRLPSESGAYYYESAICNYGPTTETEARNPGVSAKLHETCSRLGEDPRLELVVERMVPARATWEFFPQGEVRLRLFKVRAGEGP